MRASFRLGGAVAPALSARVAERLFCRPPTGERRAPEEAFLATGTRDEITTEVGRLATWRWGRGPAAVLVHGWGSRAGRWASLAPRLLEHGFGVLAYDAPAHGQSPGRDASLPVFRRALHGVLAQLGKAPALLVGHSLGGAAVALVLADGVAAGRAVLIAAPADPESFADRFAEYLAIPDLVRSTMQRNLERRHGVAWGDLHIPSALRGVRVPGLVIHDADDRDVAFSDAEAIAGAWPGAELVRTGGLGHRAVMHDPQVLDTVQRFAGRADAA